MTSVYETPLGLAALSWSHTVFGLSLRADLCFAGGGAAAMKEENDDDEETLRFRIRPWLLWKQRGSKRFHLKDHRQHQTMEFSWDLTRALFPAGDGPEPSAGYFVAVALDRKMLLVAGNLVNEAYRKNKAARGMIPWSPILISRREHVVLEDSGGGRSYKTRVQFGREKERDIDRSRNEGKGEGCGMWLEVDGRGGAFREALLRAYRKNKAARGYDSMEPDSNLKKGACSLEGLQRWEIIQDESAIRRGKREISIDLGTKGKGEGCGDMVGGGEEGHFVKRFDRPVRWACHKGIEGYFGKNKNCSESSGEGEAERSLPGLGQASFF